MLRRQETEFDEQLGRPLIGISPAFVTEKPGVLDSVKMGFGYTKYIIFAMVDGLQKIVTGKAPAEVAGPIGVAQMAGEVAEKGVLPLISFVAFLSINLGVINLLPLPALDGGHFVQGYEYYPDYRRCADSGDNAVFDI